MGRSASAVQPPPEVTPDMPPQDERVVTGCWVGLLGPVRIEVNGIERPATARRQRTVLACLALHAGEAVSADRLLEDVWGDEQPDSGVRAVAYQVSKLRSLLEPDRSDEGSVIVTTSAGYMLHVETDHVDVNEFDRLVDVARDALPRDPTACQALIEQALLLWRGRPFADLGDEAFVEVESRRLEGRRVLARRTLAESRIAQGRHADVIGDLEAMAAEHPLEEAVVQLLMTALHRSGRTADALRAYGDLRQRLGAELGIEPSGQLRQLEQQLLTGESGPPSSAVPESSPRTPGRMGNVPTPLSSFVGRSDEIREICELLSTTRLLTLLSFGGVGKTRLAIEVAAHLSDRFADGVWFVDLVPITQGVLLANTFIAGVGLPATVNRDPEDYLLSGLAARNALIVVDNCEHLVDDVGDLVGRLVRAAPDVRVLATSRLRLGVPDEAIWQVQPLAIATAAFELFSQRARLVRPGFVVDDSNHAVIEQICERLDGIPLAIELASARLKSMTVTQIAEHLDNRFRLLTRADRSADGRQRSMVATMSWSYDLLDEVDRDLLRRLSVFTDGFTLEAATVIGGDGTPSTSDVLDGLDRLVDAGLITFVEAGGLARYRMLETVRDFAAGRLDEHDRDGVGLSHATYYSTIAARIGELRFDDHETSVRLGDQELGNLRAAITWAYGNAHYRLGMSIATNLWSYFWERPMNGNENVRWGRTTLELVEEDDEDVLLIAAGTVIDAYNIGDRDAEQYAAERVRRGLGTVTDPVVKSRLLAALGVSVIDTDPRADEAFNEAAWVAQPVRPQSIDILNNQIELSWLTGTLHDSDTVLRRLGEILDLHAETPPAAVKVEAGVAACAGQWDEVVRLTENATGYDDWYLGDVHLLCSEAFGALGRYDDALAVLEPHQTKDYPIFVQQVDLVLAPIELARGDPAAALARLKKLADMITRDGRRLAIAMHVAALLAVTAHDLGHDENAAILFGFAAAEQDRLDIVLRLPARSLAERARDACRAALGPARFDELAAQGAKSEWRGLPTVDAATSTTTS